MPEIEKTRYIDIPFDIKADSIQDDGTFEGYAAVFGGKPDSYGDIVVAGAFGQTIQKGGRNRNGIAMLWYHDVKQPIGIWKSIVQDDKGLKVIGQLNLEVQKAREIHSLMKQGAIQGLSIGWDLMRDNKGKIAEGSYEWKDENQRIRLLKNVELWEISPVTFPAKVNANITKVKAITDASTERELETALRESGLSKADALYMVKLSKPSLRESEDGKENNLENNDDQTFSKTLHFEQSKENLKYYNEINKHEPIIPSETNDYDLGGIANVYNEILSKLKTVNTELKVHKICT